MSPTRSSRQRLVALSSYIGTTIEWYDFFLYGTAAAVVFNTLFFPRFSPAGGTIIAFASMGIAYLARPLGGLVIAHFGDRVGRKRMLVLTMMIMGIATVLVGLLPTYHSIGVGAPVLLLILRAIQGIGIGGEYGGAVLIVVEHAPRHRRGKYGSITQLGAASGLLLSAAVFAAVTTTLSDAQFRDWGWRVPFLASAVLVVIGLLIRITVAESPAFTKLKQEGRDTRVPFKHMLATHKRGTLLTIAQRIAEACIFNIYVVYALAYLAGNRMVPKDVGVTGTLIAAGIMHATVILSGTLSDHLGRKRIYLAGAYFSAVFAFPAFLLFNTNNATWIWIAMAVGMGLGHAAMYGPLAAWWTEQFRTNVRYSGISTAYQVGGVLGGGFAPLIAAALVVSTRGAWWPVPTFVIVLCMIGALGGHLARETVHVDQEELNAVDSIPAGASSN